MLDFFLRFWNLGKTQSNMPTPSGRGEGRTPRHLSTKMISAPIHYSQLRDNGSYSRVAGPSNLAWLTTRDRPGIELAQPVPVMPPPILTTHHETPAQQIGRSVSLPTASSSPLSGPPNVATKKNIRLHLQIGNMPSFDRSYPTDLFKEAYAHYPNVKLLSPIAEQDYFSPVSSRRSDPLPTTSTSSISQETKLGRSTPEPLTPHLSTSHPFISRSVKRSGSQASSHSYVSSLSTPTSSLPPSIPPLDLRPPFPGPHPRGDTNSSHLRPRKQSVPAMPTIVASSEESTDDYDRASLHAESFVTASDSLHSETDSSMEQVPTLTTPALRESGNEQNIAERRTDSFILRRWERDAHFGSVIVISGIKRQVETSTPAFWAFWLGFLCPILWLVGGWHFTNFGEQPPMLAFWDFYFNAGFWKELVCCRSREDSYARKRRSLLPVWMQDSPQKGGDNAFGYPFVCAAPETVWFPKRLGNLFDKPNRLLDRVYGVKLMDIHGKKENNRRVFDPWIQRCRYGCCYAMLLFCIGVGASSIILIIVNTRNL